MKAGSADLTHGELRTTLHTGHALVFNILGWQTSILSKSVGITTRRAVPAARVTAGSGPHVSECALQRFSIDDVIKTGCLQLWVIPEYQMSK